jgi:hypothetical protein
LEANPGVPVVAYQTTDGEKPFDRRGLGPDFAPKLLRNVAAEVVMHVIKKPKSSPPSACEKPSRRATFAGGLDNSVTAEKAFQNRAVYEGKGSQYVESFGFGVRARCSSGNDNSLLLLPSTALSPPSNSITPNSV